jgi:hypothetical protein
MNDETKADRNRTSTPPPRAGRERGIDPSLLEKVVPDGIKRGLETFLKDGRVKNLVGDLKLPKEIVNHILSQVDETKHAAVGVISKEVRLFLERTNLADELAKLLTQVSFEVTTKVRFVPSDKAARRKTGSERPAQEPEKEPLAPPPDAREAVHGGEDEGDADAD